MTHFPWQACRGDNPDRQEVTLLSFDPVISGETLVIFIVTVWGPFACACTGSLSLPSTNSGMMKRETLNLLGANHDCSRRQSWIFFYCFSEKIRLDNSCESSARQMIHMKHQAFLRKIDVTKNKEIKVSSAAVLLDSLRVENMNSIASLWFKDSFTTQNPVQIIPAFMLSPSSSSSVANLSLNAIFIYTPNAVQLVILVTRTMFSSWKRGLATV